MKKWLAICLAALTVLLLPMSALAQSDLYTDQLTLIPDYDQGCHRHIFVRTGSGFFASNEVELDIRKGSMEVDTYYKNSPADTTAVQCYPPMQVRVWRWVSPAHIWVLEQNFNIYDDDGETVDLKDDDAVYCVHLYFWRPTTAAKSYHEHENFYFGNSWIKDGLGDNMTVSYAQWKTSDMPIVIATPGSDTKMFKQSPVGSIPPTQ